MRFLAGIALLLATSAPGNAAVRDFGYAGGYKVYGDSASRDDPGICIAEFIYEGPGSTKLQIVRGSSSTRQSLVMMKIANYEWSVKDGQDYEIEYRFGDDSYDRTATGDVEGINRGFRAFFPADEFLPLYASSQSLHIYMGESVIDKLSLTGSAAGMTLFGQCWNWLMASERAAQAERDRFKSIPRDPFKAPPSPRDDTLPEGLEGG